MPLIIVESPTKARTFNRILKDKPEYKVFATVGHFRDLPSNKISIDYTKQFQPQYHIMENKEKVVNKLLELAKEHDEVILATDPDREGESISYHVAYILGLLQEKWPDFTFTSDKPLKRIVFHEITQKALEEALANPETLRKDLVKAQQARRILDRIVGYELSPLLWKKMSKNWLSAGRVQTVALRLIVEREKEITSFELKPYYQIYADFKSEQPLHAQLISKSDIPYEQKTKIQLFADPYEFTSTTIDKALQGVIISDLKTDSFTINDVTEEVVKRYPPPPYTTSLLQIDAYQKLGFPSKLTMRVAQSLYERGLITYHRTDSFNLSAQYVFRAKDYIEKKYGKEYALDKPRGYKTKSKLAQEAHEAIRPTKAERTVHELKKGGKLNKEQLSLYELVFNRALCTQMKEAEVKRVQVHIKSGKGYQFKSDFEQVLFDGFLKVLNPQYVERKSIVPQFEKGKNLILTTLTPEELKTKPPSRYSEGSLIRTLEDKGIGRPSTYSSIISVNQDKNYVIRESRYFIPTKLGGAISDYLSQAFPDIFELQFTAQMEENLDKVASGDQEMIQLLSAFYDPFEKELKERKKDMTLIVVDETVDELCPQCGHHLQVRYSRFGKFLACSDYPKCKYIKPNIKYLQGRKCPKCSSKVTIKYSIKTHKRFYGCEKYPTCDFVSFSVLSIPKTETSNSVTIEHGSKADEKN